MFLKLNEYFSIYRWRKASLISSIILSLISLLLFTLWIISFLEYEIKEINFIDNQNIKSTEQKSLFLGLNFFNIFMSSTILLLSIFGLFLLTKNKNNAYIFLRITTYTTFVLIGILILLISIKPQSAFRETVADNGFVSTEYLPLPNYNFAVVILSFTVIISIFSTVSRSNYGFLKIRNSK